VKGVGFFLQKYLMQTSVRASVKRRVMAVQTYGGEKLMSALKKNSIPLDAAFAFLVDRLCSKRQRQN
jgi:hypothetical protein